MKKIDIIAIVIICASLFGLFAGYSGNFYGAAFAFFFILVWMIFTNKWL